MNEKVAAGKPLTTQPSMTLTELMERFPDEDACKAYLRDSRWPNGVRCPRCGNDKVYELKARPWHWQCQKCAPKGYRFSVTTKTIFENTKYPLRTWFQVAYLMTQSKKGISALQIHRQIRSGDYRTAWFMCHRLRAAMKNGTFVKLMGSEVEVDETFIGGKAQNMHASKRKALALTGTKGKMAVIGAIARKGNVLCQMIENTDTPTLDRFVRKTVSKDVELVATDEHGGYRLLSEGFDGLPHEVINHSSGEYVRGKVHTNSIESFWALLKRGVIGAYHQVSKDYLPLYLNEFRFRFNERRNPAIFERLISSC